MLAGQQVFGAPVFGHDADGSRSIVFTHWSNGRVMTTPIHEDDPVAVFDAEAHGLSATRGAVAFTACGESGCHAYWSELVR
jgi:hypothetical protein